MFENNVYLFKQDLPHACIKSITICKRFERSFRFHAKQRTTGKVQYLQPWTKYLEQNREM